MEPRFVIHFSMTNRMVFEFGKKIGVLPPKQRAILALWSILFSLIAIVLLCLGEDKWLLLTIAIALIGIAVIYLPDRYVWRSLEKERCPDDIVYKVTVTIGDKIEWHGEKEEFAIDYEHISRVVHLKYSYALMLSKQIGIYFDPSGFTKGTFEEFKEFLRNKRPDLRIPE